MFGERSLIETIPFLAESFDQFRHLLDSLGDETLRTVALLKMEGRSHAEIAKKLGCVPRTVERKLRSIRDILSQEIADDAATD